MRHLPVLFSLSLFGSALLSFSVQPILGKMLLPMVGGAPAGWIVALAFFQLSLLAGYGVSYFLGRFSPWVHALGLLALYVAGLCYLPPALPQISSNMHGADLSFAVTEALFATIFVPFLALTATTAALQRVFAASKHKTASDPYYLFVASNIGSFVGLLAYPFLFEPFVGIGQLTMFWQYVYFTVVALIVISIALSYFYRSNSAKAEKKKTDKTKVSSRDIMMWLALSFIPCSLSMGVTTLITQDLGGFPLFWVAPLGLYLLTFVLAFAQKPLADRKDLAFWHQVSVVFYFMLMVIGSRGFSWDQSLVIFGLKALTLLAIFFAVAWACHQRLADMRPGVSRLPQYYFIIALGGGLAGVIHAFVLPYVFDTVIEFSLAIILSLMLNDDWNKKFKKVNYGKHQDVMKLLYPVAFLCLAIVAVLYMMKSSTVVASMFMLPFMLLYFLFSLRPKQALLLSSAVLFVLTVPMANDDVIFKGRNFFGTHRVTEQKDDKTNTVIRIFVHGSTVHGMSVTDEKGNIVGDSFGYYLRGGPIDKVLKAANAKTFAVLGLGTGQLGCFDKRLTTDFFEIDPDIVSMAEDYFPYLKSCPPRKIYVGDGRLEIIQSNQKYDVILQDAFTSDGIPVHLLTVDAFRDYKKHINKNGILLLHISNRNFDLREAVATVADAVGLSAWHIYHSPKKGMANAMESRWVAVPMNEAQGKMLEKEGWNKLKPGKDPWTDDKSSLISALSLTF